MTKKSYKEQLILSLIAVGIGFAIGMSPYRDSKVVNFLVAITGG